MTLCIVNMIISHPTRPQEPPPPPPPPTPGVWPWLPVIVHHSDDDGDALYVFVGDVEHQRFIVGGVQRVLLDGRLPLF